jgi:hypothetical protein
VDFPELLYYFFVAFLELLYYIMHLKILGRAFVNKFPFSLYLFALSFITLSVSL